jgi:class 3 adenylate cyclase
MEIANRREFLQRMLVHNQQKQIIAEKSKNENLQRQLLENMLPSSIVDQLQRQKFTVTSWDQLRALSHRHFGVSIMFAEVENFTAFSSEVAPAQVMEYLNDLFFVFDNLCERHEVYKVETVGDQYVAAVGVVTGEILTEDTLSMRGCSTNFDEASIKDAECSNTAHMISFAQAIIEGSRHVVVPLQVEACPVLRVGIHTGSCMSGIVGNRTFRFCLFGDTMNTAARMEQTSMAECIHVTEDVVALAPGHSWEKLKKRDVKGKGSMQTYLLRVSCDGLECEAGVASENGHPSPQALPHSLSAANGDEDSGDSKNMLSSDHFVGSGGKSSQDVSPVNEDVFRQHTKWFGLAFKKLSVEQVFYDAHARLYKKDVYIGYILFVVAYLLNLLWGYLSFRMENQVCIDPALKDFCITSFGNGAYIFAQVYDAGDRISYMTLVNRPYWRMTPGPTLLTLR